MRHLAIAAVGILGALLPGCSAWIPSGQAERLQTKLVAFSNQYYQVAELFRGMGAAEVQIAPPGAALSIDGAEYVGRAKHIVLSSGPHEFKAVWPDGATVTRRIHVELMMFHGEFTIKGGTSQMEVKLAEGYATPVKLERPR